MDESLYWVKKLKQIKEIEGFKTDKDLSDFLSVTPVTIHDYMKGVNKQMKSDALKRLRQAGYSYDWLLDDVGEPKKDLAPELLAKIKDISTDESAIEHNLEKSAVKKYDNNKDESQIRDIVIMEHPFTQHIQQESILLRELVYKFVLNK